MIHPFSFLERDSHPESIYELLELKVDRALIATIVEEASEAVHYALGLPTTSRGRSSSRTSENKEFTAFVERVLDVAEVSITDILVTLVYMRRSKAHLAIETEQWALHRVFLGALVLAHKYSNDSALRNASWSCATGVFGMRDIGRMEREFLDVMDYELSVSEADLLDLHETLVSSRSSQQSVQLHPFFHTSPLELAPRPQGGVEMFRARRIDDDEEDEEEEDEEEEETESVSSGYLYMSGRPTTPVFDDINVSDQETRVETESPSPSSTDTPTSSEFSSGPSTSASSVFSHHLSMVPKPAFEEDDDSQISALSRALLLAGHHLVSTLPTAFPQIAVSA